jgi:hypothetical protein
MGLVFLFFLHIPSILCYIFQELFITLKCNDCLFKDNFIILHFFNFHASYEHFPTPHYSSGIYSTSKVLWGHMQHKADSVIHASDVAGSLLVKIICTWQILLREIWFYNSSKSNKYILQCVQ